MNTTYLKVVDKHMNKMRTKSERSAIVINRSELSIKHTTLFKVYTQISSENSFV